MVYQGTNRFVLHPLLSSSFAYEPTGKKLKLDYDRGMEWNHALRFMFSQEVIITNWPDGVEAPGEGPYNERNLTNPLALKAVAMDRWDPGKLLILIVL